MSPVASDPYDVRGAITAARIGAPGGRDALLEVLTAEAGRYATQVLVLPGAEAREVAAIAVHRTMRSLGRRGEAEELVASLHLALRHEVWQRQPGSGGRTRALAAAALVAVALGFGAFALSLGGGTATPPMERSVERGDGALVLEGRVVADGSRTGEADVEVQVLADGRAVGSTRTDDDGRFSVSGLAEGVYDLRVAAPGGLRLPGGTATVDLDARDPGAVVLRLERP